MEWRDVTSNIHWINLASDPDLYEVLEVSPRASIEVIKRAHRTLLEKYHPDRYHPNQRAEAEERAKQINQAFDILKNPTSRAEYDASRQRS
jgi:curved DNA-binding protein CbpA